MVPLISMVGSSAVGVLVAAAHGGSLQQASPQDDQQNQNLLSKRKGCGWLTAWFEVQIREEHARLDLVSDKESKRCCEVDSQPIRGQAYKTPDIAGKANHNILSSKSKEMAGFLSWPTISNRFSAEALRIIITAL